jgi:uncharacterized protein DUF5677
MLSEAEEVAALRDSVEETKVMVGERLPLAVDLDAEGDIAAWPAAAAGLLARGVAIMETTAVLAEQGRMADAQISLRVLLEHSLVFCWIASDPEQNLVEWRRWDDYRRLKIHNDATTFGVGFLSAEQLEEIGDPPRPRSVADLAVLVDNHWSERSDGFRNKDIRTFRGLYAAVYRRSSALVHPTQEGMERHMTSTDTGVVVGIEELPAHPNAPVGMAVPMMAFMLVVYGHHFGWPDVEIVQALEAGLNRGD